MKKLHLYDFSLPATLSALLVFPLLIYIFFAQFYYQGKILFAVLLPFLLAGIGYLIYRFVFKAAVLDSRGASYDKLFIARENLEVFPEYDIRFKESVYYLRDKTENYSGLSEKELASKQIRVQATMANTRKLTEYMHAVMTPAKKPGRVRKR